jgi:PilZ domain
MNNNAPDQAGQPVRRGDERRAVRITALVYCHGRFQTARIVDFSLGGLQLDGCFGVAVTDHVAVELLSGQRLEGKAAWAVAGRVGVQFNHPLTPDDPVVALLSRAAART